MKIAFLSMLFFAAVFLVFPQISLAKTEVDISNSSSFSPQVKEFSAGQTIHVRIKYVTDYSTVNLILDDNNSNQLKSVAMTGSGNNTYAGSLAAPSGSNYYLIRIEATYGEGKKSTTVRTIKVGDPSSASLNINIDNHANGQNSTPVEDKSTTNTTGTETDEEDGEPENNVSIIRQDITAENNALVEENDENQLLKTILFVTNPILFATFLLLS